MTSRDLVGLLEEGLLTLGHPIELAPSLAELSLLVHHWNRTRNLSGHRDPQAIAGRLVLDALALASVLPAFEDLVDLGSGAGFPGIPLALLHPHRRVLLVDARERRVHFQRAAIRQLGLTNVRTLCGRIEDLAPEPSDLVLAQALAEPAEAVQKMLSWCRPGGALAIPGSEVPPAPPPRSDLERTEIRPYRPPGGPARTLWLGFLAE